MGMDAKVEIWVGVRSEDTDIEELIGRLPKDMFGEDGEDLWRGEDTARVVAAYGCLPSRVTCSDDTAGFGITVFSHDWDYGAVPFDVNEVERRVVLESGKLRALFSRFGITEEIGTWCQTDFR